MNYFAHGCLHTHRPYFLAGTAVPDWLSACDRRARVRPGRVREALEAVRSAGGSGSAEEDVIAGALLHLDDDATFHRGARFLALCDEFAAEVRERCGGSGEVRLRADIVGHVGLELLLDAVLIERAPERLPGYYAALDAVDNERVQATAGRFLAEPTVALAPFIRRFCELRFLGDYSTDEGFTYRLGQVIERVGLDPLPPSFRALLGSWRERVRGAAGELITPTSLRGSSIDSSG